MRMPEVGDWAAGAGGASGGGLAGAITTIIGWGWNASHPQMQMPDSVLISVAVVIGGALSFVGALIGAYLVPSKPTPPATP